MEETGRQSGSLVGRVVQGHELVSLLGKGGMGAVYLARHQILGVLRAIKVIHDDVQVEARAAARFHREAQVLSRLHHPGIVGVIDFGQLENGWPFLCLEYVEGRTLKQEIARGPLAVGPALDILAQLAGVLAYAHGQGVVHRDLTPGNVILRQGNPSGRLEAKVIDFGLVRMMSSDMLTRLTTETQIVGSPHYMAPEQASGSSTVTGAADVYALAGIAYTMLSGRPMFPDRPLLALVYAHAMELPEPLSSRVAVPEPLDRLLTACLAKEPAARPSAAEVAAALDVLLAAARRDGGAAWERPAAIAPADLVAATAVDDAAARAWTDSAEGPTAVRPGTGAGDADIGAALADLIFAPVPESDPSGIRDALARQMLAVVGDAAAALAATDPAIAARRAAVERLQHEVSELEVDLAVLDAELVAPPASLRDSLEHRRWEAALRAALLRRRLGAEQRQLVIAVERARPSAPSAVTAFYGELDALIERARALAARGTVG